MTGSVDIWRQLPREKFVRRTDRHGTRTAAGIRGEEPPALSPILENVNLWCGVVLELNRTSNPRPHKLHRIWGNLPQPAVPEMAPLAADQPRNEQPRITLENQQPAQPVNSWLGPIEDAAADQELYSTWDPSVVSPWGFLDLLHAPEHIDTTVPELDGFERFDVPVGPFTLFSCYKVIHT